ncbi:hypothetical protein GCM10027053_41520 [Intrasporangium mesophilum]
MRYAVDTDALQDSAAALDLALQRLERLGIVPVMGSVATGLPGGRVAGAAARLASVWESRVSDTRWMLRSLGGELVAAAESYDAVERAVGRAVADRVVADRGAVADRGRVGGP